MPANLLGAILPLVTSLYAANSLYNTARILRSQRSSKEAKLLSSASTIFSSLMLAGMAIPAAGTMMVLSGSLGLLGISLLEITQLPDRRFPECLKD